MSAIVLVKFLFKEAWVPLEEVLQSDSKEYSAVHAFTDAAQLAKFMVESAPVMVLASVRSKEDITNVLGFLKVNRKLIKEGNVKFAAVNFTSNRQVEAALMKAGCQEALDPNIRGKALKYKLDFWKKALGSNNPKGTDLKMKESTATAKADAKVEGVLQWTESLKNVDDVWILKADPKKILGKWLIKITGPSPMVAQWAEVPGKSGVWKFTFKEEIRDNFQSADGYWFFKGEQKPEFVWKENQWMITGKNFQLFYQDADVKDVRFGITDLNLVFCKNSSYALSREKAIIESFDQELLVKKGLIKAESTEVEGDQTRLDHLRGKSEGEEAIKNSPLSGKNSADSADTGPLSGKSSTDSLSGDPLSGKSSTDRRGDGLLAGDVSGGKPSEGLLAGDVAGVNPSEGLLAGDVSREAAKVGKQLSVEASSFEEGALLDAPTGSNPKGSLAGKMGTDNVGPSKYKGRMEHAQVDRQSEMGGNVEGTDDLGKSHYDGHTAHTKAGEKNATEREAHNARSEDGLAGKQSGTDDLGKSHYGGVSKPQSEKAKREARESEARSGHLGDDLSGEQAGTDDLGKSHYGGVSKPQSDKAKREARESEARSGHLGDDLSGEQAGTDDLGKSHYGGAQKTHAKKADGEAQLAESESGKIASQSKPNKKTKSPESEAAQAEENTQSAAIIPIFRDRVDNEVESGATAELTADASITALMRKKGDKSLAVVVKVEDFFDNTLICRVPATSFKKNDEVEIVMSFDYLKISKRMEFGGLAIESEACDSGTIYLTLQLEEKHVKLFEQFMQLYQMRQKHVTQFIKQAKGL